MGTLFSSLLALLFATSYADKVPNEVYEHIERGNHFYELGLYNEAGREYAVAADLAKDLPVVTYNLGNVYHQKMIETKKNSPTADALSSQEWGDRAVTAYKHATDSPWQTLAGQAFFNLGTTYAREGKIDEAIMALREALRRMPDDADTKHNLELLLQAQKKKKKDSGIPLAIKTLPDKPKKKKGDGSAAGNSGESDGAGGAGDGSAAAGSSAAQQSAAGPGTGATQNPGGSATGVQNAADNKKDDPLTQKDESKKAEEAQKSSAQLAQASKAESKDATQQATVSSLNAKDEQVLNKANDLEQRMIDGWARPPDFKKPTEKDW